MQKYSINQFMDLLTFLKAVSVLGERFWNPEEEERNNA